MGNKEVEIKCLEDTINATTKTEGETRRILQRLSRGSRDDDSERPDFVFEVPPNRRGNGCAMVGLEHFTVDQCCEPQRKRKGVNSVGAKRRKESYEYKDSNLSNELIDKLSKFLSDVASDQMSTSYSEFMESFKITFLRHLNKVSEYRGNIKSRIRQSENGRIKVEIGFLVEMHFDMNNYILVTKKENRQCRVGDIIITTDMLDIFNKARGKVDFIILSVYGNIGTRSRNVFAFKCDNPKKAITKQGIPIYVCAFKEADFVPFDRPKSEVEVLTTHRSSEENSLIQFEISVSRTKLNKKIHEELFLCSAMRAWCALQRGDAYIASRPMVVFMNILGGKIISWNRLTDDEEEWRVRPVLYYS